MTFTEAVSTVLTRRYATFSGRAGRAEYWWFVLFCVLVSIVCSLVDVVLEVLLGFQVLGLLATLALLVPSLSVAVRRLHDSDRSGWWLLASYVPAVLGALLVVGGVAFLFVGTFQAVGGETDGLVAGVGLTLLGLVLLLVGGVVGLVLTLLPGTPGPNRYGDPDPAAGPATAWPGHPAPPPGWGQPHPGAASYPAPPSHPDAPPDAPHR